MSDVYIYAVDRDYGFAPNPFHGYCTLATCKPAIRNGAQIQDWVIGIGGLRLRATRKCVFAMQITNKITFNEYWSNPIFLDKKPVRNGSQKMVVGDNIYHFDNIQDKWQQADSHHSNSDGSVNEQNLSTDTRSDKVLISQLFFYFGREAPLIPSHLLEALEYKNQIGHRVFRNGTADGLVEWLYNSFAGSLNQVIGDPFDFENSYERYSPS